MVSALESISHIPMLLSYIFEKQFSSNQGNYKVTFKKEDGKSKFYYILNSFPVEDRILKFMKPLEKEAYAIIFEKVWAVIRGGYKNLESGRGYDVLNEVLGNKSICLFNDNMDEFDLQPQKYIEDKKLSYNFYDRINSKIQKVKESDNYWKKEISNFNDNKINSNNVFKLIKDSEKNDGAIIITSINMGDGGHEYSILGTYTKKNPISGKIQDFVILKNPWRTGDDIEEKINMPKIESQLRGFGEIIKINRNHYETGVFYMPREYFEGWFRDISICKPNYKKYFPKVYDALELYKAFSDYYKIDSAKCFFDSTQGNELIKTDIISKENLESLKKIIQQRKTKYSYIYDKETLSTIWSDGNDNFEISCDYYFVKNNNSFNVKFKKKEEINEIDFCSGEVFSPSISYHNRLNSCYRIIRLNKVKSLDEIKPKLVPKVSYELFPNFNIPSNIFEKNLEKDLKYMEKFDDEIKEFIKNKFIFIKNGLVARNNNEWINISQGVNLLSDEYIDNHYHVHFYGKNYNNLFDLIGKSFKCSCYFIENGRTVKYCNKYFTFKSKVQFFDCIYYIDGIKKICNNGNYYEYNLEKEKIKILPKDRKDYYIV